MSAKYFELRKKGFKASIAFMIAKHCSYKYA